MLGHLPDQFGGARVAAIFVIVEAAGLLLIWFAPGPVMATVGAGLTAGLGYSLVYPRLRKLPPASRGLAMGLYTVFLDVALGFGSVALGVLAAWVTLQGLFVASAAIVLPAALVAIALHRRTSNDAAYSAVTQKRLH